MSNDQREFKSADLTGSDWSEWRFSRSDQRGKRRRRTRLVMLAAVAIVVLVMAISYGYYRSQVAGGASRVSVTVAASPGEGLGQFAGTLASRGVIGSSLIFRIWLRSQPSVILQAGTYKFALDAPYAQILATVSKGPILDKLVIPDGLTLAQIADRVGKLPGHSAAHFLQVAKSGQVRSPFEPP